MNVMRHIQASASTRMTPLLLSMKISSENRNSSSLQIIMLTFQSDFSLVKYRDCFDLIEEGKVIIDVLLVILDLITKMTRRDLKDSLADMEELVDYLKGLNVQEPIKEFDAILEQNLWLAEGVLRLGSCRS